DSPLLVTGRKTINAATSPKVVDKRERSERRPEAFCTVSSTLFVSDSRLVRLTRSEYPPVSSVVQNNDAGQVTPDGLKQAVEHDDLGECG
ncbi:hypothetical protein X777_12743, partial [Ooceraea biroi]